MCKAEQCSSRTARPTPVELGTSKASPFDGLVDVVIIRDGTFADMLQIVANNLLGSFLESEQVIFRQVKSLELYQNHECDLPLTAKLSITNLSTLQWFLVLRERIDAA